jgi:DNA-binding MarR family transcriptional regulator
MADVKLSEPRSQSTLLYLREDEIRRGIELLFFAYRDFVGEVDTILREIEFGRAHHRAIHFIGRNPGMPVSDLLSILRVTKQSLSRVLKDLVDGEYVEQKPGTEDRRQRLLHLTDKGRKFEQRLAAIQRTRMVRAFRDAGPDAVAGFRKVLAGLVADANREAVFGLIEKA